MCCGMSSCDGACGDVVAAIGGTTNAALHFAQRPRLPAISGGNEYVAPQLGQVTRFDC
jgi:hypothetical protein